MTLAAHGVVNAVLRVSVVVALTLACAAQAWPAPLTDGRTLKLGLLCAGACPNLPNSPYLRELSAALRDLGLVEARNVTWDMRGVTHDAAQLGVLATEVVARKPDIIIAWGSAAAARAAAEATRTIPVVMMAVPDAVENGLVDSLGRPGRNVTGISVPSAALVLKQIQILKEIEPRLDDAVLIMSTSEGSRLVAGQIATGVATLGVQTRDVHARDATDIDQALGRLAVKGRSALVVVDDWLLGLMNRRNVLAFALATKTPLVGRDRTWVRSGGLFSYGPEFAALATRAARFIQRIAVGASPSELPVEQPDRFEFILNTTAAKGLNLDIPGRVRIRADEIVD